jgi:hypothetical protein
MAERAQHQWKGRKIGTAHDAPSDQQSGDLQINQNKREDRDSAGSEAASAHGRNEEDNAAMEEAEPGWPRSWLETLNDDEAERSEIE